jgi:IS6 family transposase
VKSSIRPDPWLPPKSAFADRWFVDETDVKVNGVWRYAYRAVDQDGQVIAVLVSVRRDAGAAPRFFCQALSTWLITAGSNTG